MTAFVDIEDPQQVQSNFSLVLLVASASPRAGRTPSSAFRVVVSAKLSLLKVTKCPQLAFCLTVQRRWRCLHPSQCSVASQQIHERADSLRVL